MCNVTLQKVSFIIIKLKKKNLNQRQFKKSEYYKKKVKTFGFSYGLES